MICLHISDIIPLKEVITSMTSFTDFLKMFAYHSDDHYCIEVEFKVTDSDKFQSCFMGKTCDENGVSYWYGLTPDGLNSHEYNSFKDFIAAPLFFDKTLSEIWNKTEILSIDGCEPEDRIKFYIS